MNDNVRADQNGVDQNRVWVDCLTDHEDEAAYHPSRGPDVILNSQTIRFTDANVTELKIGLIGFYRLTQECLTKAVSDLHPEFNITSYITIKECIAGQRSDFDLIIYFLHGSEVSDAMISQTIPPLCEAFPSVPVIIFSDADRLQQPKIMRSALKSGARGFVPTQTANLPITLAAIRFVKAGGTFVPADLLLTARPEAGVARAEPADLAAGGRPGSPRTRARRTRSSPTNLA